jgi:hypothetical protein
MARTLDPVSYYRQLGDRLADLQDVPARAARGAAARIGDLIEAEFDAGDDSYGDPWAALTATTLAKGRTPPPLTDTGAMRGGIEVKPTQGAGIEVTIPTLERDYPKFHQTGTRAMERRAILPDGSELPEEWEEAIEDSIAEAFGR